MVDRSTFLQSYSRLMVRSWASDEYFNKILDDPRSALNDVGIDVPSDAVINVIAVEPTGEGKLEDQLVRWELGEQTGTYDLILAKRPEDFDINDMALSDNELDVIAGGADLIGDDPGYYAEDGGGCSTYCCCCTPCCCCT